MVSLVQISAFPSFHLPSPSKIHTKAFKDNSEKYFEESL